MLFSNIVNLIHKNDFGDWNFVLTGSLPPGDFTKQPKLELAIFLLQPSKF